MSHSTIVTESFTEIDAFPWVVKLAQTTEEMTAMYRLRHQVFAVETNNLRLRNENGLERDRYDQWCDHLIVKDQITGRVVGTYRLLPGERVFESNGFYSESEFDFSHAKWNMHNVLELGRSCVAPDHRNGRIIQLLWEGILRYLAGRPHDVLIGCASMDVPPIYELEVLVSWLKQKKMIHNEFKIMAHEHHRIHQLKSVDVLASDREMFRKLPPLLKGYLSLGATIAGEPAYDPLFDTIDFLIVMPRHAINPRHMQRLTSSAKGEE